MKLFHISDLHIGKRVNGFSMLEEQRYILGQIVELAREKRPDGVLVAGDLYDRTMPSAEAVELADWFLYQFVLLQIPVWVISGNHDCAERIAYGGRMMEQAGVYVSRVFDGALQRYTLYEDGTVKNRTIKDRNRGAVERVPDKDRDVSANMMPDQNSNVFEDKNGTCMVSKLRGEVCEPEIQEKNGSRPVADLYLLPYVRPSQVRQYFQEQTIETTQQAIEAILGHTELKKDRANILVMHQFLAGASVCESEELSVGGSDQVDVSVVDAFDYVALGHLHGPQKVGRETVRYSGSPLKYSFSEAGHRKSVTVVEITPGTEHVTSTGPKLETLPLIPRLDLREIRGPIAQLLSPEVYTQGNCEDYLHITLTDEKEILDAIGRLREVYPNIMRLDFARSSELEQGSDSAEEILPEEKDPMELFEEFFNRQNGQGLSEEQRVLITELWEKEGERR